jgi:hypothetical protein
MVMNGELQGIGGKEVEVRKILNALVYVGLALLILIQNI